MGDEMKDYKLKKKDLKKQKKRIVKNAKKEYKLSKKELKKEYKIIKKENKKAKIKPKKQLTEKQLKNRLRNEAPHLHVLEEIGNSVSHGLGALFAIIAFLLMIFKSNSFDKIISTLVYSSSMFLMFAMSCLYHSFKHGTAVKRIFRRFDYSAIYLLIGGTFAPILLIFLNNTLGNIVFIVQWLSIITGISMLGVFGPGRLKWLHFPLFFVLGWIGGVCVVPKMITSNMTLLYWILAGGVAYTIGMIPFCMKGKCTHFIWHILVNIGVVLQFIGIYLCLY